MTRLVRFACWIGCTIFAVAGEMQGQTPYWVEPIPTIRFVVMDDYVRAQLSVDWDAHLADAAILERGYCLGYQMDFWAGEFAYRITQISLPDSVEYATVGSIKFDCKGKYPGHVAQLHIHPPTSCAGPHGPCFRGGTYSYQCQPSDQDTRWLVNAGDPFAMIQCSREATVFFFPLGPGEELWPPPPEDSWFMRGPFEAR